MSQRLPLLCVWLVALVSGGACRREAPAQPCGDTQAATSDSTESFERVIVVNGQERQLRRIQTHSTPGGPTCASQ